MDGKCLENEFSKYRFIDHRRDGLVWPCGARPVSDHRHCRNPDSLPGREEAGRYAPRLSAGVPAARREDQVLYRRCAGLPLHRSGLPGGGLCVPRRRPEAGALLRVLPDGGGENQYHRLRQCDKRLRGKRREKGRVPVHGQGGLSHQRHGHDQGRYGEERHRPLPADAAGGPGAVPDPVRQRHGLPGFRYSAVLPADRRGQAPDRHQSRHDPVHDDPGGRSGPGPVCLRAWRTGGPVRAEGPGCHH